MLSAEGNANLYGKFVFDYDYTDDMVDGEDSALGGFNLPKSMIGFEVALSDKITAHMEYLLRKNVLDLAYFDWSVAEGITVSGGRMPEVFAPESEWYGDKFEGVGFSYNMSMVTMALQIGNIIEPPDGKNTGEALSFMPSVIVTPNLGGETILKLGLNAKYVTAFDDSYGDADDHMFMNLYVDMGISGLAAQDYQIISELSFWLEISIG